MELTKTEKNNPVIHTYKTDKCINDHDPLPPKYIKKKQPLYFKFCMCHLQCHTNNLPLKCYQSCK